MSPLSKLTSGDAPVKLWKRNPGMPTSKPDWPPSPIIVFSHVTVSPADCHVPLSCVPPCRSVTSCGLTERLWNWSVDRPLFRLVSFDGMRESSCLQRTSLSPLSPRLGSSHHEERSTNSPLERITPPSPASMNWNGSFGFIEAGDGGVIRSSGEFVDRSSWCDDPNRGLSGDRLARCRQLLSRIPSKLTSLNNGLSTLQFQSLSVSPHDVTLLQGG